MRLSKHLIIAGALLLALAFSSCGTEKDQITI